MPESTSPALSRAAVRGGPPFEKLFGGRARTPLYVALSTPLAILLGLLLGRYALPLLQAAFIFPVFWGFLARRRLAAASLAMLGWAVWTAVTVIWLTLQLPDYMSERILLGEPYRQEMFSWVATGIGREGDIRLFLPQHALHFVVFAAATAVSGGFLGLVMGSVLMNYMSYYVASMLLEARDFGAMALLAWPPWAAVRVAAYVLTATALADLAGDRAGLLEADFPRAKRLLGAGAFLLAADVFLKWGLAPLWQAWLLRLTGW